MSIIRNNDGSYSFALTAAQLYAAVGQLDLVQLAKDAGQGTTTPPPVTTPPTPTGFRGVFAFNTGNSSALATNPDVAGTTLMRYLAEVNPAQGVYNWTLMDNDMAAWIANGKQVIWRISTSGWANWQKDQNSKQGTPQWIYDLGVPFMTDADGARKPQYWNKTFLHALATFVQAFKARYDGHPNILCVEIGVGDGGETKPSTNKASNELKLWQAIGYTDALWWGAIQGIISMYVESFQQTPLALMPDSSFLGGTKGYDESLVVNYAAKYGVWLQWNGLIAGASLPGSFSGLKVPVVCEQLNAAGPNKRSFLQDAQTAIKLGGIVFLAFTSDLEDSNNAASLKQIAAMVSK
jgi:hypothetical protein